MRREALKRRFLLHFNVNGNVRIERRAQVMRMIGGCCDLFISAVETLIPRGDEERDAGRCNEDWGVLWTVHIRCGTLILRDDACFHCKRMVLWGFYDENELGMVV